MNSSLADVTPRRRTFGDGGNAPVDSNLFSPQAPYSSPISGGGIVSGDVAEAKISVNVEDERRELHPDDQVGAHHHHHREHYDPANNLPKLSHNPHLSPSRVTVSTESTNSTVSGDYYDPRSQSAARRAGAPQGSITPHRGTTQPSIVHHHHYGNAPPSGAQAQQFGSPNGDDTSSWSQPGVSPIPKLPGRTPSRRTPPPPSPENNTNTAAATTAAPSLEMVDEQPITREPTAPAVVATAPQPVPPVTSNTVASEVSLELIKRETAKLQQEREVLQAAALSIRRQQEALDARGAELAKKEVTLEKRELAVKAKELEFERRVLDRTEMEHAATPKPSQKNEFERSPAVDPDYVSPEKLRLQAAEELEKDLIVKEQEQKKRFREVHNELMLREQDIEQLEEELKSQQRTLQRREAQLDDREGQLVQAEELSITEAQKRATRLQQAQSLLDEKEHELRQEQYKLLEKDRNLDVAKGEVAHRESLVDAREEKIKAKEEEVWGALQSAMSLDSKSRQVDIAAGRLANREEALWGAASAAVRSNGTVGSGAQSTPILLSSLEGELTLLRQHLHEVRGGLQGGE